LRFSIVWFMAKLDLTEGGFGSAKVDYFLSLGLPPESIGALVTSTTCLRAFPAAQRRRLHGKAARGLYPLSGAFGTLELQPEPEPVKGKPPDAAALHAWAAEVQSRLDEAPDFDSEAESHAPSAKFVPLQG
jgi:hypothetical protein